MWQAALEAVARPLRGAARAGLPPALMDFQRSLSTWGPLPLLTQVTKIPGQTGTGDQETPRDPEAAPGHPSRCTQTGLNSQENLKTHPKSGETHTRLRKGGARAKPRLMGILLGLGSGYSMGSWPFTRSAGWSGCSRSPSASAVGTPPGSAGGDPRQPSRFPW